MKLGKPLKNNAGLYKSGKRNQEKGKACRDKLQAFFCSETDIRQLKQTAKNNSSMNKN